MKVAILLSGQPRNYRHGYWELKKTYLDRYDCDIYFHTWDDTSFTATQFFNDRPVREYNMGTEWKSYLIDLYRPKNYKFDAPIQFDKNNIVDSIWRQPLQNSKAMWYSILQSFSLVPANYDCYIRTRFDLRYEESLSHLESLDLSKLHVWDWDTDARVKHRGYYDVFAIGNYDTMGIYAQVYNRMDWYLNNDIEYRTFLQGGWPGQDSGLRNEYLLRWHLTSSGVPVEVHKTTIPHADGQIIR
jgi:hypothetical protein